MNNNELKGYKILVTAGSTWIPIDTVRVITNIFKGKIGLTIAEVASNMGADVTLLLGPSLDISKSNFSKNLQIVRFKFFDDLEYQMDKYLLQTKFDAVIHSAAVSDFKLTEVFNGKIKSDTDEVILKLTPTNKLVDKIKIYNPDTFLVKFKLEVSISDIELKNIAYKSMIKSNADLIVANIYDSSFVNHEAFIIDKNKYEIKVVGKENIAKEILRIIHDRK